MDRQRGLKRFGQALHLLSVVTEFCRLLNMILSAHIANTVLKYEIFWTEMMQLY